MIKFNFTRTYLEGCDVELQPLLESNRIITYIVVGTNYLLIYNTATDKAYLRKRRNSTGWYSGTIDLSLDFDKLPENIQNMIIFNADLF